MTKYEKSILSALRAGNAEKDKLIDRLISELVFVEQQLQNKHRFFAKDYQEFFYPEEHRTNTIERILGMQEVQ